MTSTVGLLSQYTSSADIPKQFAGKMTGTIIVEPLVQRFGFKAAIYVLCGIQFVGCICRFYLDTLADL
jgi:hypothetical protein